MPTSGGPTNSVVVLNQECSGTDAEDMEHLFDDVAKKIILSNSPEEEIVTLLTKSLKIAAFDSRGEEKRFSWDEDSFIREGYVAEYLEPLFLDRGYSFLRRVDDPLKVRVMKF